MVLAFHCWLSLDAAVPLQIGPWQLDATSPMQHGYLGVHLFLLLSGFCLTYPLCGQSASDLRLDLRRFALRRAWRILPPYYVALALFSLRPVLEGALRLALGKDASGVQLYTTGQIVSHFLMIHNFSPGWVRTINGSFWSLALEWQLYMVFPLLVWGFRRFGPARTLAVVLLVTLSYRSWVYLNVVGPGDRIYTAPHALGCFFAYTTLPGRLFEFSLGMLAAVLMAGRRELLSPEWSRRYLWGALAAMGLAYILAHGWSPFAPVTDVVWGLAFFCLLMYAGGCWAQGGGWFGSKLLVRLGLISYSVYLIHEPLVRRAGAFLQPMHLGLMGELAAYGLIVAPVAVLCGWMYYRFVESRFLRFPGSAA
jgi:peptidoglycan/LPS O-acetylase OafA/YrhL